jgi:hypothetical protein
MRLTDIKLRALKPRDTSRYYVTDGRGLSIEVFPSGAMAWRYRYQLAGKTEKVALGRYPYVSLKDARLKRDELATLVAKGQSPASQKRSGNLTNQREITVRDFAERYYKEVECLRTGKTQVNCIDTSSMRFTHRLAIAGWRR